MTITLEKILQHLSKFNLNLDKYEDITILEDKYVYNFNNFISLLDKKFENKVYLLKNYIEEHYLNNDEYLIKIMNNEINEKLILLISKVFNINIVVYHSKNNFFRIYFNTPTLSMKKKIYCIAQIDKDFISLFEVDNIISFIEKNKSNIFTMDTEVKLVFNDNTESDEELINI